jgi:hypothetical protein
MINSHEFILPPLLPLVSPGSDFIPLSIQSPSQSELEAIATKPLFCESHSTLYEDKEPQSDLEHKRSEGRWKREEHEKFLEGTHLKKT